tara:strand:+ start:49 stop:249 length:201 start_codon:yes stop_codon:yes gene_type:complete
VTFISQRLYVIEIKIFASIAGGMALMQPTFTDAQRNQFDGRWTMPCAYAAITIGILALTLLNFSIS